MKKLYLLVITLVFVLASCGGGGGGGGSTPTTPSTPAPTVNLSADPTSVLLESTSTLTWSSTNATSCSASWTSQTGTSGSEAVTITTAGNNSFSITCTGAGGSGSASVTVEGYRNTDGVVVDGYISGAEVFIDEDDDWLLDSNENSTTSDNDGKFTIKYANGNLVSIGGTDLDSQTLLDNLLITHKLTGHSDFKAVTPVTSIAAFMEDASLVNAALGIDSSIDVSTFDPVANKGDGGINDYLYEKGNQLTVLAFALQNITNNLNTTTETTQDYFKAITEEIEKEYTETETKVDIETETFITNVIENVIENKSATIDETAKANVAKALSGMLPIIQVKSSDDLTTSVIRFALSTLQTDIQAIANGTATAETVTSYTEDLLTYIAEDQNVDSGEIAPDISAIADSASTSEDTEVEINVLLNDSYVTASPFSLSATNGTNGSTSISNNLITYSPDADYNGSDSFSYTITQGEKTSSADVTLTIEAVNDAPTIDIASTIQVEENQTAVTTVSVSDVDEDELTLTLGGTDADSFNLSDENVLTFKEAPDYETKTSYSITLSLTDGTETVTKEVTIAIIDINDAAPVFTSDATFSAAENQTAIGTVTATDPEGDSFSFSISGTELSITSEGVLSFTSAPDYETKAAYTATVTVVDTEDNSATQDITVNVTNVNDNNPSFTSSATFSAAENQTAIGTVTATDADDDAVTFTVSGTELAITSAGVLTFVEAPDYETKAVYTATVTASDGTNTTTQNITVNVTNVNDVAPVFTSSATFSAAENQTAIGTVTATDDEGDDITFTVSGSELSITSAGVLTFVNAPDYETKSSYTATVTASDGVNSTNQDITVNVNDILDNDGASPVLSNLTASPSTVDVTTEAATITLTIDVT
ncbi:MAG: Ig-like domain-containing protein, partial [Proteobacteria bacterium]|nr:Ig-like domain-containing protein [Pseudomonadota bacterium]